MTAFSLVKNGRVVNTFELRTIHLNTFPSVLYIRTDCPRTIFLKFYKTAAIFSITDTDCVIYRNIFHLNKIRIFCGGRYNLRIVLF